MNILRSRHFVLPHLILAFWLSFVALSVWRHAERSVQPPIYDALSYFYKAKFVWDGIKQSRPFNPLNVGPAVRPPGTVLMSYPFGFSPDFHGFYFRSVFLPILCLLSAVYIIGWSPKMSITRHWAVASISIFLSTIPIFYHFEFLDSALHWGRIDNFLAGVAAVSVAACFRSFRNRSVIWTMASACLAAFCILHKPSGAIVIALIGLTWFLCLLFTFKSADQAQDRKRLLKFATYGFLSQTLIFGTVVYCCFQSEYLSNAEIARGRAAVAILKTEYANPVTLQFLHAVLYPSLGYPLLIMTAVWVTGFLIYRKRLAIASRETGPAFIFVIFSSIYLGAGLWFWIFQTSIVEIRYFVPFLFMAIIGAIPLVLETIEIMPGRARLAMVFPALLTVVNMGLLLGQPSPPSAWQYLTGVNLSSGAFKEEVDLARGFMKKIQDGAKDVSVFSLDQSPPSATFECFEHYQKVLDPTRPGSNFRLPIDWQRPTVIRFDEMLDCDYILFQPIIEKPVLERVLEQKSTANYQEERQLISAFLSTISESDGVKLISETKSSLRLLEVSDRTKLKASLQRLIDSYYWRPIFLQENHMCYH